MKSIPPVSADGQSLEYSPALAAAVAADFREAYPTLMQWAEGK